MRAFATIVASVALLLVFALTAPAADRSDLTGRWSCDDGARYHVRQVGEEVWWFGSPRNPQGVEKPDFANLFHGTISGNTITGSWTDTPAGQSRNYGKLTLEIVGGGKRLELRKKSETGGFSGGVWKPIVR